MVNPGSPLDTWTSTDTGRPTAPVKVAAEMAASMHPPFGKDERIGGRRWRAPERVRRSDYVVGLAGLIGGGVVADPFGESALSERAAEP